jgi:SAM-dependent methyltransferase
LTILSDQTDQTALETFFTFALANMSEKPELNRETQKIFEQYERRKNDEKIKTHSENFCFNHFAQSERELFYTEIIKKRFRSPDSIKLLEIGAGTGGNLFLFKRIGIKWENIYANELLPDRLEVLKSTFPKIQTIEGDACDIEINKEHSFDIVFQSTVFTSILDLDFKTKLANVMWSLLKPGGIILWYDFAFDNPYNKDVKGIKKKEIGKLFSRSKGIVFHKTTLAPPIGRKVKKLYPFINIFPFLRTHLIAEIEK